MKRACHAALVLVAVVSSGTAPAAAQTTTPAVVMTPPPAEGIPAAELEMLVAPIALYPDVLIAQILPASTFPTDVVMAARWLRTKPDMKDVFKQTWDVSVKALCNYPDVIYKLDEDLEWTNALGAAFLAQPADVMAAIQAVREQAQSRELLKTTPQQTVVVEQETIRIVPTEPDTIYVPQYQPQIIYVDDDDDDYGAWAAGAVGFGAGLALGAWLNMDCDWHGYSVHYCRPGYWGGWAHHGHVAWGDDWVAGVGPRGGFIAGEDRGVAVGRYGGAAWGPNGGAVWRRPAGVAAPLPAYGGRYAGYSRYPGANYNRNVANNINVNRNNVNIDRGDRTNIRGGDRTAVGGDRTSIGRDRTAVGGGDRQNLSRGDRGQAGVRPSQLPARTGQGAAGQRPGYSSDRRSGYGSGRSSAFDSRPRTTSSGNYAQRGQQSRSPTRSSATPQRTTPSTPRAQPSRSVQPSRSSAYNSSAGRGASSYGSRGAASRGGGGARGGGGRGGGRR